MTNLRLLSLILLFTLLTTRYAKANDTIMAITPQSCMAKSGWCETQVSIDWQLSQEAEVCIEIKQQKLRRCFEKSSSHSTQFPIKSQGPITIILVHAKSNQELASQVLNVFVREHKKRKRQRHIWSIIL